MIGIVDWGIGGLSIYSAMLRAGKSSDVLYFSDSGFTPYGKTEEKILVNRLRVIGEFLKREKCEKVLLACNAASSVITHAEEFGGIPFMSIIPAAVKALEGIDKRIGVIGGRRTIEAGIYQRLLHGKLYSFAVAQPLSALVEAGNLDGSLVEEEIIKVISELPGIEGLLLACTHYPALSPVISKLYPKLLQFDPADKMIALNNFCTGNNNFQFITTGDLKLSKISAKKAFGIQITKGTEIQI